MLRMYGRYFFVKPDLMIGVRCVFCSNLGKTLARYRSVKAIVTFPGALSNASVEVHAGAQCKNDVTDCAPPRSKQARIC